MIKQYPHFLYKSEVPAESSQDAGGNYSSQVIAPEKICECREETSGRGREIMGADQKLHVYASVIFLPVSCPDVSYGTVIEVRDNETDTAYRLKGEVIKFDRGQLHCRLWI